MANLWRRSFLAGCAAFGAWPSSLRGEVKITIDLVAAVRLIIDEVRAALGATEEARRRRAQAAVPTIADHLLRVAASKDQIAQLPASPREPAPPQLTPRQLEAYFARFPPRQEVRARDLAHRISTSLAAIQAAVEDLDPGWKTRNIEAMIALYERVAYREGVLLDLRRAIATPGGLSYGGDRMLPTGFFQQQHADAEELRRLARALSATLTETAAPPAAARPSQTNGPTGLPGAHPSP